MCGVVKNTDARLTGCGARPLIELIMTRSDLFLISNYVHFGCAGYMILVLMTAPVVGLPPTPTGDYKRGGKGHCLTPQVKFRGTGGEAGKLECLAFKELHLRSTFWITCVPKGRLVPRATSLGVSSVVTGEGV